MLSKLKSLLKKSVKFVPIILIISLALVLRLHNIGHRAAFDADQEEIAGRAKELLTGHLVLLGPKTSLGGFSIGPGFTYVWGFFSVFTKGDPIAGAYASIFCGIVFIILIYLVLRKICSEKTALLLSFIAAISTTLIVWDQSPWAPSLFYISEMLIIYGLHISDKKSLGMFIVALGFAVGFQAHFTIFLLIPSAFIYWLIYKPKIDRRTIFYSSLVIIVGLLPVVVFDIAHNFVNFGRLLSVFRLVFSGTAPAVTKIFLTLIANSASFYYFSLPTYLKILIFILIMTVSAAGTVYDFRFKKILTLLILFLLIPFIFFLFYRSDFSEYYLMSALPPFIILSGYVFEKIKKYYLINLVILIFLTCINIRYWGTYVKMMNLGAKREVVHTIIKMGGRLGYGVSLSLEPGYRFGYQFLFDYFGATPNTPPAKDQKKIFTIIAPPGYGGIESFKIYDGIGLRWQGI